jgi:hypothetical protein
MCYKHIPLRFLIIALVIERVIVTRSQHVDIMD